MGHHKSEFTGAACQLPDVAFGIRFSCKADYSFARSINSPATGSVAVGAATTIVDHQLVEAGVLGRDVDGVRAGERRLGD